MCKNCYAVQKFNKHNLIHLGDHEDLESNFFVFWLLYKPMLFFSIHIFMLEKTFHLILEF